VVTVTPPALEAPPEYASFCVEPQPVGTIELVTGVGVTEACKGHGGTTLVEL
jgi:hypothetical protein